MMDESRDNIGRFTGGNVAARGRKSPLGDKVAAARRALQQAVTTGDVKRIIRKMVQLAIGGDVKAAALVLDRKLGPVIALDIEEQLQEIESRLELINGNGGNGNGRLSWKD